MKELLTELYNRGFGAGSNHQIEGTRHESLIEGDILERYEALTKRVAELETMKEKRGAELWSAAQEHYDARCVLEKRVVELESQVTEQRAVPIPMGLGEVCVSECHDGDGVLREIVIHARRSESQPVGTPLPDGYVGLPLPNGEILARIRIENADGARMVLLDSLERCINAAYVADGKAPMPTRADLQAQLAWTPVAQGFPTEPGLYVFLNGGCNGTLFELQQDGWYNHDTGNKMRADGGYESLDDGYWGEFRRITLPEAT